MINCWCICNIGFLEDVPDIGLKIKFVAHLENKNSRIAVSAVVSPFILPGTCLTVSFYSFVAEKNPGLHAFMHKGPLILYGSKCSLFTVCFDIGDGADALNQNICRCLQAFDILVWRSNCWYPSSREKNLLLPSPTLS